PARGVRAGGDAAVRDLPQRVPDRREHRAHRHRLRRRADRGGDRRLVAAGLRESPFWPALEAVAPTIAYDGRIMGATMSGQPLPAERSAPVTVPTQGMYRRGTEPRLITASRALAGLLPAALLQAVEGAPQNVDADW